MSEKVIVLYSTTAKKNLQKLEPTTSRRIVKKINYFSHTKNPLHYAKALGGELSGKYRYRIGEYRAIFSYGLKEEIVVLSILYIAHRKDVYK